jgi:peptidoglycan/LPS O-acetylase OafA/YrhL/lysophospholipase L1-like esterase
MMSDIANQLLEGEPGVVVDDGPEHRRQPALDGVRAVAVVLVLLFHAGISIVPAGYLGVSVFFTLSGYLITTLLLREHDASGRIDLRGFWSRRLRRLLPASTVCLLAVVVAAALGAFATVEKLRTDIVAAALQVFNWVEIAGSTSYGELFSGSVSPVAHYWSLAIEEQFYWIWPFVLGGLLTLARRTGRSIGLLVVATTMLMTAIATAVAIGFGPDVAYWSTVARLPEILVGACVAVWLRSPRSLPRPLSIVAILAMATIVALSCAWPSDTGPAYAGWLPAFALVSAALIVGLQVPGTLRRALSVRPVVWVGSISYGVYLFHWPIFVVLRERGWDLATPLGLGLALGLTFAAAVASFSLLERRIRTTPRPPSLVFGTACIATGAVIVASIALVTSSPAVVVNDEVFARATSGRVDPEASTPELRPAPTTPARRAERTADDVGTTAPPADEEATVELSSPTASGLALTAPLGPAPSRPVRILVVGDSTSLFVAEGLASWSIDHPDHASTDVRWCQGCTFLNEPLIEQEDSRPFLDRSREVMSTVLPETIASIQPDVVALMVTVNDAQNRRWSDEEGPLEPSDPRFVARAVEEYTSLTQSLLDQGVGHVVWIVPPEPLPVWSQPEMNEPGRYAAHRSTIRTTVESFPEAVSLIDLNRWIDESGLATDRDWRPDGVHLEGAHARMLAEAYLGPLLISHALGA